jgi:hypothetical protein
VEQEHRSLLLSARFFVSLRAPLGDLDLVHARDIGSLRDVRRKQAERVLFGLGFYRPPDRVPARPARRERGLVAKWALMAFEGGEDDAALPRLVMVLEQKLRHGYFSTRLRMTPIITKLGRVWAAMLIQMLRNRFAGYA